MTAEPSDRTIILHLLRGAVPEHADEISRLWSQYGHAVDVAPSAKGVTMNADAKRIQFDTKTIDFFWLLGFSAWRAVEVYMPALHLATSRKIPLDLALNVDAERGQYEFDYKQRIATAQSLIAAEQTGDTVWPTDVPEPTADRESLGDVQHIAAFDLVALALAFALLHEFRHVMFCVDNSAPATLPEKEIACDVWARDFLTSSLAAYAKAHEHNYAQVHQKRAMGTALAAVIIHAMTPIHAHWGNRQYPPIAERLTAMIAGYSLPADSRFWPITACLLIALMRQENRPLDVVATSNQEMVEILLDRLRQCRKERVVPVYFIGEDENGCSPIKIGVAKNIDARKRNLQTGNPLELRLLGWIEAADPFQLERHLHQRFGATQVRGEWFAIVPADILPILQRAGRDGFVAKNADAFQIIGYDRDAIPEYLGVWEWADLEIDECCPFCGCLCGMHFQDASQMYHCIGCDTLTDFSELDRQEELPQK